MFFVFSNITETDLACLLMFYQRPVKEGTLVFKFHVTYWIDL